MAEPVQEHRAFDSSFFFSRVLFDNQMLGRSEWRLSLVTMTTPRCDYRTRCALKTQSRCGSVGERSPCESCPETSNVLCVIWWSNRRLLVRLRDQASKSFLGRDKYSGFHFFTQNFVWFYKIVWWSDRLEIFRSCSPWPALFPKVEKKFLNQRKSTFLSGRLFTSSCSRIIQCERNIPLERGSFCLFYERNYRA